MRFTSCKLRIIERNKFAASKTVTLKLFQNAIDKQGYQ